VAYFDLISAHSYKMSGFSGTRYCFYKGKPVEIDASDAEKFRMHKDIFFECDENGQALTAASNPGGAKTFVTFRPNIANRDVKIEEDNKQAMEQRKAGVDVNELLKEVNKDASDKKPDVGDGKAKKEKKVKVAKNPLECELCGYIAKDTEDLRLHLDKHSEED